MKSLIIKLLMVIIFLIAILFYFRGDSTWFFEPSGLGNRASFKIEGTIPAKTSKNFGGFYKGFPGNIGDKVDSNW